MTTKPVTSPEATRSYWAAMWTSTSCAQCPTKLSAGTVALRHEWPAARNLCRSCVAASTHDPVDEARPRRPHERESLSPSRQQRPSPEDNLQ